MNSTLSSVYTNLMINKDMITAVYALLLDRTGQIGVLFIFFSIFVMLWLKNQSMTIPTILSVLIGGMMLAITPPETHMIAYILTAFGVMGILYKVFKS